MTAILWTARSFVKSNESPQCEEKIWAGGIFLSSERLLRKHFSHIAFFAQFRLISASTEGVQWFIDIDNEELIAMTRILFLLAAIALPFASASAAKPCEELKTEIAAKMDAKGVKDYSLEIVASDQAGDRKVVGSCDGGTNKILYSKTPATEQPQSDKAK